MEILQTQILEWIAISFSQVSDMQADSLPSEPPGKPKEKSVSTQLQSTSLLSHFSHVQLCVTP